jgi:branched-chain amino acid transport system ATP-binding protein
VWRTVRELALGRSGTTAAIDAAVRLLGLEAVVDVVATDLSQGQRKLVGVARALAAGPRFVCLDEPAAGLSPQESEELGRRLRDVVDAGTPMLLVDHDMGLVLSVCDCVVVLEFGRKISEGPAEAVAKDPLVISAYLGGAATEAAREAMDRRWAAFGEAT